MRTFCTIITGNYLPYALALYDSIRAYDEEVELKVLVSDVKVHEADLPPKVELHFFPIVCVDGIGKRVKDKYQETYHDAFRWSMKPVYMDYLLNSYEQVIYVDCDIQFTHSFDFLFDLLNHNSVVLSPHFRSSDPKKDVANFLMQFYSGIYNGGFVGANREGKPALKWWAEACIYVCKIDPCIGQFVDQTHLNLMPVFFENVFNLKHRGCNVANWNQIECVRTVTKAGDVLINDQWPVVFIHFTNSTILGILKGGDLILMPYLKRYDARLQKYGKKGSLLDVVINKKPTKITFIQRLKRYIHYRTKN